MTSRRDKTSCDSKTFYSPGASTHVYKSVFDELVKWKEKKEEERTPLIIQGPRFVGKTWLVKMFAKQHFSNYVYVDFKENVYDVFYETLTPQILLDYLAIFSLKRIMPGKTLIIFDNLHLMPYALNSVRLFKECAPQYHICCITKPDCIEDNSLDFLSIDTLSVRDFIKALKWRWMA